MERVEDKISLNTLHNQCLLGGYPFVAFRYPQSDDITTLVQVKGTPRKLLSLKELDTARGFLVTPFVTDERCPSFLIEPDIAILNGEVPVTWKPRQYATQRQHVPVTLSVNGHHTIQKGEFISQVDTIKTFIEAGTIDKLVLSRTFTGPRCNLDIASIFDELCKRYPNAFVYMFQLPQAGCWIGATPEPLLLAQGNITEAISLAGTRKHFDKPLDTIKWSVKEIEEQDIVTRYVEDVLRRFGINVLQKTGPYNQKAGLLVHLKTRFIFNSGLIGGRLGELVEALHPTPSVLGSPRDIALGILSNIEKHHREYYTGLLGPVNLNGVTAIYVNLRCMKVLPDRFILYLGAGITAGSKAEDEWEETNYKKMTLLSVINSLHQY